ncbi:hypothetical protein AVJ23_04755 [Pseudoponticoccus marisrubri]|uniref:Uncharacterized protein n=1 Tax=Pseudoponticoccus marisrubri TaxID=1685382 RepID=A0A0W7WMZ5_9RHOB|nr:hypothetical protein AVJ23_04755 [Pseudoponticoccus marisrubri]
MIAGAGHPLGASLCLRLAGFGATVVALDRDEEALIALARQAPDRIEPLALRPGRRDVLTLLGEAWGATPLDLLIDLLPMTSLTAGERPGAALARSAGLVRALLHGIRQGSAQVVMAVPRPERPGDADTQARAAAHVTLVQRCAPACRPGRVAGLGLPLRTDWSQQALLSAGDLALMLCHPVSRGLQGGSVVDWAQPSR